MTQARADQTFRQEVSVPDVFLMTDSFETGGSERQFSALARWLKPGRFRVHLGCIQSRGAFLQGFGEVPRFPLGGSLYGARSLQARFQLARHLRSHNVSVAQSFDFYSNLTLIPAALWARVPVVIGSQRQLGDLLSPAQEKAQALALGWCDAVVCNSRAAAARLTQQGIRQEKLVVIGNGLPREAFCDAVPAFPRQAGILRIGMIARMNARYKNHEMVLRALASLGRRLPKMELVLVGDGPLRPEIERAAEELGVRGQVIFAGERRDIANVLASMDVSVLTSTLESLSNVVLESMAAGVPVIATRVGGNPELINGERGELVESGDYDGLAVALAGLLQDPDRRAALGRNARRFAQQNFSLETISSRYEELYAELLKRKSRLKKASRDAKPASSPRVAIVAPTLRWVGGQSVQADLLVRYWRDSRDADVQFIPVDPELPWGLRWATAIPGLRTLIREPIYVLSLWRRLRDVEVAHIFSASYASFLLAPLPAWVIARMRGVKTLINYRSGEAPDHLRRSRILRRVLAGADRLVTPSEYLVEVFREFGLHADVVPNIVDLSQFSFRARQPLRPRLICTRGFHPYYGMDVVVRAFAQVRQSFPDAQLTLAGKGQTEAQVRELVAHLKLEGVRFAGVASRGGIGRLYDEADIFINASRLDNMPVSVLEAFAAGTPVVSTDPAGMRYVIEHEVTGLLSETGNADALARNVLRLLQDPGLASRLARNALQQSHFYSWPAVREQWLGIYRSLARPGNELAGEAVPIP